jgi:3-oxoacyl-[acyl-carrier-protein] synthase-3/beta-ketoacyl ACP synthase
MPTRTDRIIATSTGPRHATILGLGVYRPVRIVSNEEISGPIDSSDEWIRSRSGIATRRFAGPEETVISMSVAAAGQALEQSGIAAEQIGCVVLATSTYLSQTPAAARRSRTYSVLTRRRHSTSQLAAPGSVMP